MPDLEEIQALVAKGYEVAVVPAWQMADLRTQNFSKSWSILPPPGNVVVRHEHMFAIQANRDCVFDGTTEALRELAGITQVIRIGRTLTTCVFRYGPMEHITVGTIPNGRLARCEVMKFWHLPPTSLQSPHGVASASYVLELDPAQIPAALDAELRRYGFLSGEVSK